MELAPDWPQSPHLREETFEEDSLLRSIWGNPPLFSRAGFPCNRPEFHQAGIATVGAIGTARSVARLYASLDEILSPQALELGRTTVSQGWDAAHAGPVRFGVGFQLQTDNRRLGPEPDAFGHDGAGGSVHGAWPAQGVGFSCAARELDSELVGPHRSCSRRRPASSGSCCRRARAATSCVARRSSTAAAASSRCSSCGRVLGLGAIIAGAAMRRRKRRSHEDPFSE